MVRTTFGRASSATAPSSVLLICRPSLGLEQHFAPSTLPAAAMRQTLFMSSVLRAIWKSGGRCTDAHGGGDVRAAASGEGLVSPHSQLTPSRDCVSPEPGGPSRTLPQ